MFFFPFVFDSSISPEIPISVADNGSITCFVVAKKS